MTPKLVTRAMRAKEAADEFKARYCSEGQWSQMPFSGRYLHGKPEDVYRALLAADGDLEAVERILPPETGWTRRDCDNCDQDIDALVEIGSHSDDEYGPCYYCRDCVAAALEVFP